MWVKLTAFVSYLIAFATLAQGANITIDASCSIDSFDGSSTTATFSTQTNIPTSGGCSIGVDPFFEDDFNSSAHPPFAGAQGGIDYGVASSAFDQRIGDQDVSSGEFYLTGFVNAKAYMPSKFVPPVSDFLSLARVTLTLDLILSSGGPPRPGLIDLLARRYYDGGGGNRFYGFECQVGSINISPEEISEELCPNGIFPFMLGEPFVFHFLAIESARDDGLHGWGNGRADPVMTFRLMELDGTPVDVLLHPVPESSTFVLLASALMALVLQGIYRRKLRRSNSLQ